MANHWKKIIFLPLFIISMSGCLGLPENAGSDELVPETASEDTVPENSSTAPDEFADFDKPSAPADQAANGADMQAPPPDVAPVAQQETPAVTDQAAATPDEFAEFEDKESQPQQQQAQVEPTPELAPAPVDTANNTPDEFNLDTEMTPTPAPVTQPQQAATPIPTTTSKIDELDPFENPPAAVQAATTQATPNIKIKSIQYKANETGGAIVVKADGPINFTTRNNPDTDQLVVEIPGAQLPDRLKRPFNMRDIKGIFGSLDPYQEKGSNVARFVVQLRANATDPFVTAEGDTLLIVADKNQVSALAAAANAQGPTATKLSDVSANNDDKILTSRTLQEFLTQNSKFYGKKISIETNSMNVRDALRFISEEGGVNMVIADNITGNVSLKLRDIPWDQAFVIIMRSKELGYVRQGNVLRVATLAELRTEEEAAIKLTAERIKTEPLVVKVFSVNYAKVDDLATKVKDFLTERGKVVGDMRTNTVVVTDVQQSVDRVNQLIQNLDTQPPQVLIEGRIIEATDEFTREMGINWNFSGQSIAVGHSSQGNVSLKPNLTMQNGPAIAGTSLNFQMGTLDIFGQLSAALSLAETENKIRILASPRVVTLSNEKATINETIKRPYQSVVVNGNTSTNTVTFQNIELVLEVTPQITSDASVIMNMRVKRDLPGAEVAGQAQIETREAVTKVMVRNGQTSVIGGVYQNDSTSTATGVPWLKDVPVLGSLFKYSKIDNRRTELMIFVTPRIVAAGSDSIEKTAGNQ
jgi:type IV pilus assembly protein PilQ